MADGELIDVLIKLAVSLIIGLIIGGERQYRNKSAGFRTIALICLGATVFAILSDKVGQATGGSRIAANVVTGIGFLGAGAIMREGLNVTGLTTASTIWLAAALGMAVGIGEYSLAWSAMILTFFVLTVFERFQNWFFKVLKKTIEIHLNLYADKNKIEVIEGRIRELGLEGIRKKEFRQPGEANYLIDVVGKEPELAQFIDYLNKCDFVKSFSY
jgi:putative Mg2+ transporter-C (MgtC) family protein